MAASPSSYTLPQVLIYDEYQQIAPAITANLQACIVGPNAYLARYAIAAEKAKINLGSYQPAGPVVYAWPSRPPGALVDTAYSKLFIDNAKLEYLAKYADVDASIVPVAGSRNQLHCTTTGGGFQANGSSFPRYASLHDRDVQLGDLVTIRGIGTDNQPYSISTYVTNVTSEGSDKAAATVQSVPTAAPSNGVTQSASAVTTLATGSSVNLTLTASISGYSALADGALTDTYTVAVIQGSINGDLTTALLSVTTASGLDNVAALAPSAAASSFAVGARGLYLSFAQTSGMPDLVPGQSWHIVARSAYVTATTSAAGTYTGTDATTYLISCLSGGTFAGSTPPLVVVSTTTGVDSSGSTLIMPGTAIPIGTRGVTFTLATTGTPLGLRKGDSWAVTVNPATNGAFRTLTLGRNLPAALLGATSVDLHLALGRNIQVSPFSTIPGVLNWTQLPESLTVQGGLIAYDPSWTSGGVPLALPVVAGSLFIEYRAFLSDYVGAVGTISDPGTLDTVLAGPLDPDNPLKWGIYEALANSNGANVTFTAVSDPTSLDAWVAVLDLLVGRQDVYNLVPLTTDRAVQDLFAAHITDQSGPLAGHWRAGFFTLTLNEQTAVVTAATTTDQNPALAVFTTDPNGAGTTATILEIPAANVDFTVIGVKPGDLVRTSFATSVAGVVTYQSYVVDAVLTGNEVRLVVGPPAPLGTPQLVEFWHPNTKDEQAADIGRQAGSFANRRICAVWPDRAGSAGTQLAGYYVCAALAGQVSGSAPHRGLSNAALAGFDDLSRSSTYFNANQLNVMAGSGVWIVTQDPSGTVKTRLGITTDPTDLNSSMEMVRRNVDSINLFVQSRFSPFVGVMNVTPSAISQLMIELVSALEFLKANGFTDTLGPQLIDGVIVSLRAHSLLKDRVVGVVNLTIPYSLDTLEMHLII